MTTNCLYNETPTEPVATFNPVDGRAIIETPGGAVYTYDPGRPRGGRVQQERAGLHAGMFLQPALAAQLGSPIEYVSGDVVGEYPFKAFQKWVEHRMEMRDALTCFLTSIDPELSIDIRQKAARKATHMLKNETIRSKVEKSLLAGAKRPGEKERWDPTYGPTEGEAGMILKKMLLEWS